MSNRCRSQGVRAKYAFIKAYRGEFDTTVMCRLLDESRSGFYEWLRKPLSDRALEDQRWLGLVRVAHMASHGVYGGVSFSICEKRARRVASIVLLGL
jgi:hypothetical protein